jgi:hypothetical protein
MLLESSHHLHDLDEDQCWRLLEQSSFGRLGFTSRALPAIVPTTYTVHHGELVIASLVGSKVDSARREDVVVFEVDRYDRETREGWSVNVIGRARVIEDPSRVAELDLLGFSPWVPDPRRYYITVEAAVLRGEALCHRVAEGASVGRESGGGSAQ